MRFFPHISPLLSSTRMDIVSHVTQAFRYMPEETYREYHSFLTTHLENSQSPSFIRWILFNYFHISGFLQARVEFKGVPAFTFGVPVTPWSAIGGESEILDRIPEESRPRFIEVRSSSHNIELKISGIVPALLEEFCREILAKEILPLAQNYYFAIPGVHDRRHDNLFDQVVSLATQIIDANLQIGLPVSFTHFNFQNLESYFDFVGQHRSLDIIQKIEDMIRENLIPQEMLITMAPHSYLVITPGEKSDLIRKRFRDIFFHIESLVLDFSLYHTTVDQRPYFLDEVWRELNF